ncbi:hypothetical protein ACFWAR_19545 [Streptomyces sp. NPDC059917]|uniref:hypothetical protein n=1 Tax=Streptomyces sp. NPDC059917 TaxID=3347002 RepID=UPI003656763A
MSADPGGPRPADRFPQDLIALQQDWIGVYNRLARRRGEGSAAELRAELFRLSCRIGDHPHWVDGDPSRMGRTRLWQAAQVAPGGEPQVVVRLVDGRVVVTEPEAGGGRG